MTVKPVKNACVHIWVNNQNRQLTGFDPYSNFQIKCLNSRRINCSLKKILTLEANTSSKSLQFISISVQITCLSLNISYTCMYSILIARELVGNPTGGCQQVHQGEWPDLTYQLGQCVPGDPEPAQALPPLAHGHRRAGFLWKQQARLHRDKG